MGKVRFRRTIALTAVMGACFTAGVYAKDTLQKVDAYLRPDFTVKLDGSKVNLAQPPLIYNGSSYLPLKALGELLGAEIGWEEQTMTIHVKSKPAPSSGNSGTGSGMGTGSSSGGSASDGSAGNVPSWTDKPPADPEKEIKLSGLACYELVYKDVSYPVLANVYKNSVYLRLSDLEKMPFSLSDVKLSMEKQTQQQFVHIDQVKNKWKNEVKINLLHGPVTDGGTLTDGQKKALDSYFGAQSTVYTLKMLSSSEITALVQNSDKKFVNYNLKLTLIKDDSWSVSGVSMSIINQD